MNQYYLSLDDASRGNDALDGNKRIDDTAAAENRTRIQYGIAPHLRAISHKSSDLQKPGIDILISSDYYVFFIMTNMLIWRIQ